MRKTISKLALAAVAVMLLGSCNEINERIDNLENRINGVENETIKDIAGQISSINSSIADLGSIRSSIQSLTSTAGSQDCDIESLQRADEALGERIDSLSAYVNGELVNYAKTEWVEATFLTLAEYEKTCDTIAMIDAKIGDLDTRLSGQIATTADSLESWINVQFGSYYTAAQMDAKLEALQAEIDSTDAENKAKADSIASELAEAKAAVDSAKANIRAEYRAAIDTAITALDGKLSKALQDSIASVNGRLDHLTGWVKAIDNAVVALTGRVKALEDMIQSVSIVPYYSDGSLAEVKGGILTIDCIITPASAAKYLNKEDFKVLVSKVKTKASNAVVAEVSDIKLLENGVVTIYAQVPDKPGTGYTLTAAVRVKDDKNVDYTTNFHSFDYSDKNVKVVDFESNNKVYIAPSNPEISGNSVAGNISINETEAEHIVRNKPTAIEVKGIGTVTFNDIATNNIIQNAENVGATNVFFKVEDVTTTKPVQNADVVIEVTMKTLNENGTEVFSEEKAGEGSVVTIQIPFDDDVAYVKNVALVDASGDAIEGGVVEGSIDFDDVKRILTFKVNHFSMYAVEYLKQAEYKPVTSVRLAKTALNLVVGKTESLSATVSPNNASVRDVIWGSSNTAVATVDKDGKVKGVSKGTATITVTTVDGNKTAKCDVTVINIKAFKAVYDTNSEANTLTFYYDAVDHSGDGTVYEDGTDNYLFDNATKSNKQIWGYNSNRSNIKSIVIDPSVADYKGLTSTAFMFQGMTNATNISGAEYLDVSNVTDMSYMFNQFGLKTTNFNVVPDVSGWDTGKVTNMSNMFNSYGKQSTALAEVPNVQKWNTEQVKDMSSMFKDYGYYSDTLNKVPVVSDWNTVNVTNMSSMFHSYGFKSTKLEKVPIVSNWNTEQVNDMSSMFNQYADSSTVLTAVPDVSNWETDNVTNMNSMFREYGYKSNKLNIVPDVSKWKTDSVTNMGYLFGEYGYTSTSLNAVPDVSKWDTGKVTDWGEIFRNYGHTSTALNTVPVVSGWETDSVTDIASMFDGYGSSSSNIDCDLDLSGWDLSNVESESKAFDFHPKTFNVTIPANTGNKYNTAKKWYCGSNPIETSKSVLPAYKPGEEEDSNMYDFIVAGNPSE